MPIELKAGARDAGKPLKHFWSECVGAGRANEGLRADWQAQLATVAAECGFRRLRFHGLFHDDMFVYREEAGVPIYNFQYVDALFDRLLEIGVRPFVEFGFSPGDLATERGTIFWWKAHGSPPHDYGKWAALITETTRHWLARYGAEEVRSWYFEVWNEPNLDPFFRGTKSQYFELYRVTAQALKALDPALRVGGPATSNFVPDERFDGEKEDVTFHRKVLEAEDLDALDWRPVWLGQFLAFCAREELPVDFVSVHPYPTDWALDAHGQFRRSTREVGATPRDLKLVRKMVTASAFPTAEIHLTEWSSSSSPREFTHDYLQAATYVVKANLESIGTVDSLSYWAFSDVFEEAGAGDTIFHGGFGMLNLQGIPKPTFHAYRFLHQLGDELLSSTSGAVVTRHAATGKLASVAYHYPPEMPKTIPGSFDARTTAEETLRIGQPERLVVRFEGLAPGAGILVETLDQTHGNAMAAWTSMGQPARPTREETAALRAQARATRIEEFAADDEGVFALERAVEPWSVVLVREVGRRLFS